MDYEGGNCIFWSSETLLSSSCAPTLKDLNFIGEKAEQSLCYRPVELPASQWVGLDPVCQNHLLACLLHTLQPRPTELRISMDGTLEFAFLASSLGTLSLRGVYMCVGEVMGCLDVMQRRGTCRLDETS